MLYAEICLKVRKDILHFPSGRALCLLTLGHISAYNMDSKCYCIIICRERKLPDPFFDFKKHFHNFP
jgi:hypothetical protein